jgi:hypothetical protein
MSVLRGMYRRLLVALGLTPTAAPCATLAADIHTPWHDGPDGCGWARAYHPGAQALLHRKATA